MPNSFHCIFSSYKDLLRQKGINSICCHLGRWTSRTALQTILTCALQHAPGNSSRTEGSKWKKKQNQNMHKPCQSPSWPTWASLSCSEPGCPKQEHKNITQTGAFTVSYGNQTMLEKNPQVLSSLHIQIFRISHCYRQLPCEFKFMAVFVGVFLAREMHSSSSKIRWHCWTLGLVKKSWKYFLQEDFLPLILLVGSYISCLKWFLSS